MVIKHTYSVQRGILHHNAKANNVSFLILLTDSPHLLPLTKQETHLSQICFLYLGLEITWWKTPQTCLNLLSTFSGLWAGQPTEGVLALSLVLACQALAVNSALLT